MSSATQTRISVPPRLLYGPGPTTVDSRVLQAMTRPALGIRDPVFLEMTKEIRAKLRAALGTTNHRTMLVPGSGSSAMEMAVANAVEPGMKMAIFANGQFANRMTEMAQRQRAQVVRLERPWGEVFTAEEAEAFITREKPQVVGFIQAETSTGAYQNGRAISEAAHRVDALVIGDVVTSLGAMPVELDRNGIDIAYSCAQKGLSCPAGLSPISINDRAWERIEKRAEPAWTWYLDARMVAKYFEPPNLYHHTPSAALYHAMYEGLSIVEEEGLEARWERHRRVGAQLMEGLIQLGFEPLVTNPDHRLWHLATVKPPEGVDEAAFRQRLLARHNIEVGAGIGQLAGKILRVGAMGPLATEERVSFLLEAMREELQ